MKPNTIKVIGFDADDTLWVNEPYFQEVERQFCLILKPYLNEAIQRIVSDRNAEPRNIWLRRQGFYFSHD